MLAQVLNTISRLQLSVLTIHQSVPMEDKATITLSLNAQSSYLSIDDVVNTLREIEHVSKVELISMSSKGGQHVCLCKRDINAIISNSCSG